MEESYSACGIGCDATSAETIAKIYKLKNGKKAKA
jgi:tRNA A37 threonylcarbamoyladenosine synthetase subunit TsaC/SUA5/YrdC